MSEMIVRNPSSLEVEQAAFVASKAFPDQTMQFWQRDFQKIAEMFGERFILVVELEGRIISSLICTPSPVYIHGAGVTHSGVGSVGTLPEFRKRGSASAMMTQCVKLLRDEGIWLSSLWPFSYEYYRKFGWEVGGENRVHKAKAEVFAGLGDAGGVRRAARSDFESIKRLYDRLAPACNCLTRRSDEWWERVAGAQRWLDAEAFPEWGAVVYQSGGETKAYAVYETKREQDRVEIGVRETMFHDPAHRRSLLAYLANDEPEAEIVLHTSGDDPFMQELPNPRAVQCSTAASFQFRVIDPGQALLCLEVDSGIAESLSFCIHDPVFEGGFEFSVDVEQGRISPRSPKSRFRIETDVQTFARLYSGYVDPIYAHRSGWLRVSDDTEHVQKILKRLFGGYHPYRSGLEPG